MSVPKAIRALPAIQDIHEQRLMTVNIRKPLPAVINKDIVAQHVDIAYCHSGSTRFLYNSCEYTVSKGDLVVVLPGHVLRQLESTDDFEMSYIIISNQLIDEEQKLFAPHDYGKFSFTPICPLPEDQKEGLSYLFFLLSEIAKHDDRDIRMRHQLLQSQLFVLMEFVHFFFRQQEKEHTTSPQLWIFRQFCNLVSRHYQESREVKYYAALMDITPNYLTKVFREEFHLSPAAWIEQYIVAQAKRLIEVNPLLSFAEVAYTLGFSEPNNFYRYFKRVAGMTAKEYRDSLK